MKIFRKFLPGILVFLFVSNITYSQEIRTIIEKDGKISKKTEYGAKIQFRNNLDTDILVDRTDIGGTIGYKIAKQTKISGGLKYSFGKNNPNDSEYNESVIYDKYRLNIDLKYKNKKLFKNTNISNRLRFQYYLTEHNNQKFEARDKIMIEHKYSKNINFSLALEPYYSFEDNKFTMFRLYGGNEFKVLDRKVELFFIFELNNHTNYQNTNQILGLAYIF